MARGDKGLGADVRIQSDLSSSAFAFAFPRSVRPVGTMASSSQFYDWERPKPRGGPGVDSDSDDPEPSAEEAGEMMVAFLLDLLYTNSLSARSLCVICYWASLAGAQGPVSDFKMKPSSPTGHFQRKVDKATGVDLAGMANGMHRVGVPQHKKHDMSRTTHAMPIQLPHEALAGEAAENPDALTGPTDPEWTEAYLNHPVVRANPGRPVMPIALYLDGISFTRVDSLLGVFVYSLHTLKRHLVAVLRRSEMCKCGCKGWCSLYPVFAVVHWSFTAMAQGLWPSAPVFGEWGPHDESRKANAGKDLGFVGALLHLKGDWSEFSHTLGFADWSSKEFPCMFCTATRDSRFDLSGFSVVSSPWATVRQEDVEGACRRCEVWRVLSREQHATVRAALEYDKRRGGGSGRCLMVDIEHLQLFKGDRLEPHLGLPDVAMFDSVSSWPCRTLFWRRSNQTRARHRNPLFDPAIGITLDSSLMVDKLHTLHLGPALVWTGHALWKVVVADVFGTKATGEALYTMSVQRIRGLLWPWYRRQRQLYPEKELTQVQDLTVAMLGGKPSTPNLGTKAAETKGLLPFALHLLREHRACFEEPEIGYLIGAGAALQAYFDLLDEAPRNVPPQTLQLMYDAVKRHVSLSQKAGVPLKPKHHLLLHLVERTKRHGNPGFYATFADEGMNRVLKKVGQAAHRSVWEARVFLHFGKIEETRRGQKRPR